MGATGCERILRGEVGTLTCLACHDGQTAPDQRQFENSAHMAVGCEACHGPGYFHIRNGGRFGLFISKPDAQDYQFCGRCHQSEAAGFAQSGHAREKAASCLDCHDVHSANRTRSSYLDNALCLGCHAPRGFDTSAAIEEHTFHAVDPAGTGASRCSACHMPPLQRLDQAEGPHGHSMIPLAPITSNEAAAAGVTPTPPNSCAGIAGCHDGSVITAPVFDVDNIALNEGLQAMFEARYGAAAK